MTKNILLDLRETSVRNIMSTLNLYLIFCLKNLNTFYDAKIEKLKIFIFFIKKLLQFTYQFIKRLIVLLITLNFSKKPCSLRFYSTFKYQLPCPDLPIKPPSPA